MTTDNLLTKKFCKSVQKQRQEGKRIEEKLDRQLQSLFITHKCKNTNKAFWVTRKRKKKRKVIAKLFVLHLNEKPCTRVASRVAERLKT